MEEGGGSIWETSLPLRVDMLAPFAYLFGPISAFALLVGETKNDYVRFHGTSILKAGFGETDA